ncbi:AraC family transcriptional regulator [Labilibacter sediminis]|nr:AraC family transcriptional regulator [Labilibacter sediminis]
MIFEDYFKIVLLVGAALTFLMAVFLWFYPRNFFANKVLGLLIFLWGFTVVTFVLQSNSFWLRFPHLLGISTCCVLLFFPLMYIYIKTYLYKDARKLKKYWMHLIPLLAFFAALSPFYFQSAATKIIMIEEGLPDWVDKVFDVSSIIIVLQGVFYSMRSIHILQHFQYFRKRRLTQVQLNAVKWLKQFVLINVFLWAVGVCGTILDILRIDIPFDVFKIYYLGLTILTIWMAYFTLKKPHLFSEGQSILYSSEIKEKKTETVNEVVDVKNKEDLKTLVNYMENSKPYLNNEMNLQHLVDGTGLTKHRISEVLNKELNKSFYDVLNEYRTKEAIKLMNEGIHKQQTLTSLAEKAGFNSKATFNRIFKKTTGKTPTEYIQGIE